jgi:cyanophycinase
MGGSIHHPDIMRRVAELASGGEDRVPTIGVVLSSKPSYEEARKKYEQDVYENGELVDVSIEHWFENAGFNPVPIWITIDHRDPAYDRELAERVASLDSIYLCGGSQARHVSCLLTPDGEDTPVMEAIRAVQDRVVASGSSAGAAAMGAIQYGAGDVYEYLKTGSVGRKPVTATSLEQDDERGSLQAGLGVLGHYGLVTCTHFGRRHRLGRLLVALREVDRARGLAPDAGGRARGLGVDEDTALFVEDGGGTVVGENGVYFVDTSDAVWGEGPHFSVTGIRVTYLSAGDTIDLESGRVTSTGTPSAGDGRPYDSDDLMSRYESFYLMRGLARSSARRVTGTTRETDPGFRFVFSRDQRTKAFMKGREFTLVDAVLDVVCEPGP